MFLSLNDASLTCSLFVACLVVSFVRSSMAAKHHTFVICLFPLFAVYMCTLLTVMTWTLRATLTFADVPVAPDEVRWNIFWLFGWVVISIFSVPTDYVSETSFLLTWRAIWSTTYISVLCAAFSVGGTCPGARCIVYLFVSVVYVSHRTSCIDYSNVGALSLCVLGLDCLAGGVLFGRSASVVGRLRLHSEYRFIDCNFVWRFVDNLK